MTTIKSRLQVAMVALGVALALLACTLAAQPAQARPVELNPLHPTQFPPAFTGRWVEKGVRCSVDTVVKGAINITQTQVEDDWGHVIGTLSGVAGTPAQPDMIRVFLTGSAMNEMLWNLRVSGDGERLRVTRGGVVAMSRGKRGAATHYRLCQVKG